MNKKIPMYEFSSKNIALLVKLGRIVAQEIKRKKAKECVELDYDRATLLNLEVFVLERQNSMKAAGTIITLEALIDQLIQSGESTPREGYQYLAIRKILNFESFYMAKADDEESVGILRNSTLSKVDCEVTPEILCSLLEVSPELNDCVGPLLKIEWAFLYAFAIVRNRRYSIELCGQAPLALLLVIQKIINKLVDQCDRRSIVPTKYAAEIDGEYYSWSGRGRSPVLWRKLFSKFGKDRFNVNLDEHKPVVASNALQA